MKDDCEIVRKLLDERAMNLALDAMALDLVRLHPEAENLIVMGMATRGIPLANEISQRLTLRYGKPVLSGELDASFYRDDFHYRNHFGNPVMRVLKTPVSVEGKTVVLVDDVLYTGRSVRAAMQAVFDLGRPAAIRLCCLIDRGCRELPIAPDCIGLKIDTAPGEEVRVRISPLDNENAVYLVKVGESK
ncbi:MAG: bifunctional pyr operon transcriptional regulator/uracil phosphoribosyltransferase PyrR [Fibrobacteraceae bacterium]|nr:bifunctional pyr operon transcriptional regulator/uracil phosphoribosyltransferase PyrR [Fibrobacteraceae bacterium]